MSFDELPRPLRDKIDAADGAARQRKSPRVAFECAVTGVDSDVVAAEYALELVAHGHLKAAPVTFDCHQSTSDDMVIKAFKAAKGGLLIVKNIEHLVRQEAFGEQTLEAVKRGKCAVVVCGTKKGLEELFDDLPHLRDCFPVRVDMSDDDVLKEASERKEKAAADAITHATVVQEPVQPMRPLTFKPKTET